MKAIGIKEIHMLARSLKYPAFEAEIAKMIDHVLPTETTDNEYIVVNANVFGMKDRPCEKHFDEEMNRQKLLM